VVGTRSGLSIIDPRERVFVVDFDLGAIDISTIAPRLSASAGELKGLSVIQLPDGNVARVGFHFIAGDAPAAEFRLWLESEAVKASEVWLYRWTA
jgi:glucan biosynthesis protein